MGTLPEVPSHGLICLPSNVSSEFDKKLASTDHPSADNFLEHLFELFSKQDENARFVKVRLDIAQKFSALQQGSQFSCSSDLMKHLLHLHSQKSKETASVGSVKQVQEKQVVSVGGRKSRKSQPKRNFKHQVLIDSHSDDGEPVVENSVSQTFREKSVSSEETEGTPADVSNVSVPFDLSVVKQEVMEEEDQTREVTGKGRDQEQRPLCLSLHKPKFAQDTHRQQDTHRPKQEVTDTKPEMITLQSVGRGNVNKPRVGFNGKKSKPLFQLNWRSSSEPPNQYTPPRPPPLTRHGSHDNSVSSDPNLPEDCKNGIAMFPGMAPIADRDQMEVDTEERNSYNYVLNSLASDVSEKYQTNSLPGSPMHVPVSYPKSIQYVPSSDEEEPQDLSYGSQSEERPQNLTMSKPQKPTANQPPVKAETIKYDSNANAVAVASQVAQHEKTQFIAQPPFSVPANLIFNDHRSVKNELLGQPQVFQVPHNTSSGSQEAAVLPPQPGAGVIFAAQPPRLQVVNVIGTASPMAAQIYVQSGIISSKSNFQGTPALAPAPTLAPAPSFKAVTSPDGESLTVTGSDTTPSGDQASPGSRKKRKKMDDTTPFRDPPETSLPFNGPNKYRFYCDVCDTGFTRRYTFNRHKCKGRVEKHYCQLCDKAYLSKYKLKDHILVKHEGQTVSCPDCGKKFSSRSSMEMHKKQQHEDQPARKSRRRKRKIQSKKDRHKRSRNIQDVEQVPEETDHVVAENVQDLEYQYQDSGDVLEAPEIEIDEDLVPNEDFENEYRELEEAKCDKSQRTSETGKSSETVYTCSHCKQCFKSRAALNMHTSRMHAVSGKNRLLCKHCFKQFVFQHELELHKKFVCKRVKRNFECPMCKLKFFSSNEMDNHLCSGDPTRPYFCATENCRYTCKSITALREHCKRHLGIKPYLCNICGCAFSTKTDMDRHADSHKDSRDIVCKYCGKTYKSRHSLMKHVTVHTHKDRFKCNICSFVTPFQNDLRQHLLKHTERKHKCTLCKKSLRSAASLSKHMVNIHSANKIFSCQFCDFSTTVGNKFSGHMLKHRKDKEVEEFDSEEHISAVNLSDHSSLHTSTDMAVSQKSFSSHELPATQISMLTDHTTILVSSSLSADTSHLSTRSRSTHVPTLTEATLAESEEVEISGQGADALMSNIVASSYGDIAITQDAGNPNLSFYVADISGSDSMVSGPSTISMPSLMMPDTISSMADSDAWCSTDQT